MAFIKKLDIFILKNYLTLFAGTFCISLFVVMMQFLWKYIDDLVGKGLSFDVYLKFFFYAAETLVPLALPLAILLASLISFGNIGERLELLAIKAAGISLIRTLRPLIILNALFAVGSYYFQDKIAPEAQQNVMQLLYSMREKSPELDIPEGVFYDGIENINLYVKKKNKETGMLYDVIIYNMQDGVNKAHIILADSAKMQTSANKKHLLLHLYQGEQFENLNDNALQARNVPYRRETFVEKHFIIDFDTNFNMTDEETVSGSAMTKNMKELLHDIDSLNTELDSISAVYYQDMQRSALRLPHQLRLSDYDSLMLSTMDSSRIAELTKEENKHLALKAKRAGTVPKTTINIDSLLQGIDSHAKQSVYMTATSKASFQQMDIQYKADYMSAGDKQIRRHWIKFWEKITTSLACLMFFFIGAPLGAIIRKGGLGFPVVIAVVIFLLYYIINTGGMKVGREGSIPVWLGMWISTMVLMPLGIFFTVKSNNDSAVFNMDAYKNFFRKLWGIRNKRHITRKEVIIYDPDYPQISEMLGELTTDCRNYLKGHRRRSLIGYVKFIFSKRIDAEAEKINQYLEYIVDSLHNSKDKQILLDLNYLPIMDPHEFRFYRRRKHDMKTIIKYGEKIKDYIDGKYSVQ